MSILRDNWITEFTYSVPVYNVNNRAGQTFTPSANYTLESVQILIHRHLTECNTYTVALQETVSEKPSGVDLATVDFDGDLIALTSEWKSVDLSYTLTAGVKYAIVLRQKSDYSAGSFLSWDCYYSATYVGGQACTRTDTTWGFQGAADADYLFKIYSAGSVSPSDAVARASSIRHIFRPGFFRMQLGFGDLGFDVDVAEATVRSELDTAKEEFIVKPGAKEAIEKALADTPLLKKAIEDARARAEAKRRVISEPTPPPSEPRDVVIGPTLRRYLPEPEPTPPKEPWWKRFVGGKERIGE